MLSRDTIAAIATAPGRSAIGIVRLSGTHLGSFAEALTGARLPPRVATRVAFCSVAGEAIDEGIALYFPAPASYTGEDVLELQGHGGTTVLRRILARCFELGARAATPGEFTQRAFINGKLDLLQAESVIDLIDASTEAAARSAMRSLQGEFSRVVRNVADQILEVRALLEATLDFPEEDVEALARSDAEARIARAAEQLEQILQTARQGMLLREGIRVVLAGAPNVGKSSVLNRLAGEERAIVTEIPGTTRDTIRESISLDGVPVHVIDTAGLRQSDDPVERIGIERARRAIENADLVLHLRDATQDRRPTAVSELPAGPPCITVFNKIDLSGDPPRLDREGVRASVWLSAKSGLGFDHLRQAILDFAGWNGAEEGVFLARERHLEALNAARTHALAAKAGAGLELMAEELRLAHRALASLTGEVTADDLLGVIFQRFCIGK